MYKFSTNLKQTMKMQNIFLPIKILNHIQNRFSIENLVSLCEYFNVLLPLCLIFVILHIFVSESFQL